MRAIKILLVIDSLEVGGAERHVVNLALAVKGQGHDVEVACSMDGPLRHELRSASIPVHVMMRRTVKRRVSPTYAWRLRWLMRRGTYDLVHAHVYASAVASALATLGTRIPLILTAHTEGSWHSLSSRWINGRLYPRADQVIAISEAIRRQQISRHGVSPARVRVITNAIPLTEPQCYRTIPELPTGWEEAPLLGVVGRLQPEKGVDIFLEAVARVVPHFPRARYVVIGDGPLRASLVAHARDLGLEDFVHFAGTHPDARSLMSSMDVLAVPSRTEGSPLVVLEAMAIGLPIVAAAVGSIPQQIRHHLEGLLFPPGDYAALAEALLCVLRNPTDACRLGLAARGRLSTHLSYAVMLSHTMDVYHAALGYRTPLFLAPSPDPSLPHATLG